MAPKRTKKPDASPGALPLDLQVGLFDVSAPTPTATPSSSEHNVELVHTNSLRATAPQPQTKETQLAAPSTSMQSALVHSPTEPSALDTQNAKPWSVTELSEKLRSSLKEKFSWVRVEGEIADFKGIHRSGHLYFAIKDDRSQLRAVAWKSTLQKIPFEIKQGLGVILTGKLDYYGGGGSLQLVVESIEPIGIGSLQLKFEQLKAKLLSEGLLDASRKKRVPSVAWRIGVVTSKTGAALQDMLRIFSQRFPLAEIALFHSAVQGERAPAELVAAIDRAERFSKQASRPLDVLIVARGGGSYEDLFCFNDERVVRRLAQCALPTVSAIGHEIDITLCDGVADKRAATPSHAAQETVPDAKVWLERLRDLEARFEDRLASLIRDYRQRVDHLHSKLLAAAPSEKMKLLREQLLRFELVFSQRIRQQLDKQRHQVTRLAGVLEALSPLRVVDRGFAIVRSSEPTSLRVLRSVQQVAPHSEVQIFLADGSFHAKVSSTSTKSAKALLSQDDS